MNEILSNKNIIEIPIISDIEYNRVVEKEKILKQEIEKNKEKNIKKIKDREILEEGLKNLFDYKREEKEIEDDIIEENVLDMEFENDIKLARKKKNINYREKYLKYKNKYLNLKQKLEQINMK